VCDIAMVVMILVFYGGSTGGDGISRGECGSIDNTC